MYDKAPRYYKKDNQAYDFEYVKIDLDNEDLQELHKSQCTTAGWG